MQHQSNSRTPIPFRQYRRAFIFVAPYWQSLLAVLLLGLFSTFVGLVQPYISRLLIDEALLRRNLHALWQIATAMVAITIVGFVVSAASSYYYTRLSAESLFRMRLAIFEHLQRLSPRYFAHHKLGDIVSRINNDIGEVQRVCADTLLSIFSNVLFLVGSLVIMVWLNPRLTVASLALLPFSILALRHYQRRLTQHTFELRQCSANLGSFLIESIMGMRLIVSTGAQKREADRFAAHNDSFVSSLISMQMTSFLASGLPGTVLTLSTATVFLYGGKLVIEHQLTLGAFVAFMAYHVKLLSPVQNLLGIYTSLLTGGVSLSRVFEVLDVPVEVVDPQSPRPFPAFTSEIRFQDVGFRYTPHVPVLANVCFTVPKHTICAIVGSSGAGKSTIGDLLVRFFDVQNGAITIDGIDIRDFSLADLRSSIAIVEQTPYLFHATVRENIAYSHPSAAVTDIHTAAAQAGIHNFIDSLPHGYETIIGERGSTLSVGERQRIALARALLRKPAILLLDEPTSALDPRTESLVTEKLASSLRSTTIIVITHRRSLVETADHVIVLDEGRIVQQGHPSDLLHMPGYLAQHFSTTDSRLPEASFA
jgi:ATP-binding cassette subfamily B protein